jgi:hypothetical protein
MVALRWDPPLPSETMRTTTVNRPLPVRTPADGGVRAHVGYAGTVSATENRS